MQDAQQSGVSIVLELKQRIVEVRLYSQVLSWKRLEKYRENCKMQLQMMVMVTPVGVVWPFVKAVSLGLRWS